MITDAEMLRGLANWLAMRPQAIALGGREHEATGTSAVADDLRRIADALATAAGQRELLAASERERVEVVARERARIVRIACLEGELERAYAAFGRFALAEWRRREREEGE